MNSRLVEMQHAGKLDFDPGAHGKGRGSVLVEKVDGAGEHAAGANALADGLGELRGEFHGWKILFYSESPEPDRGRCAARIIARRA